MLASSEGRIASQIPFRLDGGSAGGTGEFLRPSIFVSLSGLDTACPRTSQRPGTAAKWPSNAVESGRGAKQNRPKGHVDLRAGFMDCCRPPLQRFACTQIVVI